MGSGQYFFAKDLMVVLLEALTLAVDEISKHSAPGNSRVAEKLTLYRCTRTFVEQHVPQDDRPATPIVDQLFISTMKGAMNYYAARLKVQRDQVLQSATVQGATEEVDRKIQIAEDFARSFPDVDPDQFLKPPTPVNEGHHRQPIIIDSDATKFKGPSSSALTESDDYAGVAVEATMAQARSVPPMPQDGSFCHFLVFRIDMAGSEETTRELGPAGMGALLKRCQESVDRTVAAAGGIMGGWQGDGAVAFFATVGDDVEVIRRGEAAARSVIERLMQLEPQRRFRIGIATGRGRFFTKVGRITEDCVTLAARLEETVKDRAEGSAILAASSVHATLTNDVRKHYHEAGEYKGEKVVLFLPRGSRPKRLEAPDPKAPELVSRDLGFEMIDPAWPWAGKNTFYFAMGAWPLEPITYEVKKHRPWIDANFLRLRIGTPNDHEQSIRDGFLRYDVIDKGVVLQHLKFSKQGSVVFGDAGWPTLGGPWTAGCFPEAVQDPLAKYLEFLKDYYTIAHGYAGNVFLRVGLVNVAGRQRLVGDTMRARRWQYDRDVITSSQVPAKELDGDQVFKQIYKAILTDSEIDADLFLS